MKIATKIQRWGNSLAVRLPKSIADSAGIVNNDPVDIQLENGKITVLQRIKPNSLDDLVAAITDENLHAAVDTGEPVGNELL